MGRPRTMTPASRHLRAPLVLAALSGVLGAATVEAPAASEPAPARDDGAKGALAKGKTDGGADDEASPPRPLLGTLVHLHNDESLPLGPAEPSDTRFTSFLADRVTASTKPIDPRLLGLLRTLATSHPGARIEIVSGYRSEKLNEQRRKKGRHVASHSQHSLGQAVDFRIVLPGETRGIDPRDLEKEIRAAGWDGGIGTYLLASDWFVHADVGKNRRWRG